MRLLIFLFVISFYSGAETFQESDAYTIKTFLTQDHQELAFRFYPSALSSVKQNLIYLHGIESHGGWFDKAAVQLNLLGYNLYALDRRGSGLNKEQRGFVAGHVDDYQTLIKDIDSFIDQQPFLQPPVMLGLSWGGKLAMAYQLHYPQKVAGLVLITPGFVSLVDLPWYTKIGIFASNLLSPESQFALPIPATMFTTTPYYLNYIKTDPLRNTTASARFLMQSRALDTYLDDNINENKAQVLLFLAGQDKIIDNTAVTNLLQRATASKLTIIDYPEQTHSIQFDKTEVMVHDMIEWIALLDKEAK